MLLYWVQHCRKCLQTALVASSSGHEERHDNSRPNVISKRDIAHVTNSMQQQKMSTDSARTLLPSVQEIGVESRDRHCRCSMHNAYQEIKTIVAWRSTCQNINFIENKSTVLSISFHFKQFYSSTPGRYPQHTRRSVFHILARCHQPPDQTDELKISSPNVNKNIYQSIQRLFSFHFLSA
jgi:hypothetical protein